MFDFFSTKGFKNYVKQAQKILDGNWTGHYTKPSPTLYPHQWNWDSGFIAIGFMPLFGVAATTEQAKDLYGRLNSLSFCSLHQGNCFTIPNYDMSREEFDSKNYWRGPVWININWMLSQIFNWYIKDLGKRKDLFKFLIHYLNPDDKAKYLIEHMDTIEVEYLFYGWNLNH